MTQLPLDTWQHILGKFESMEAMRVFDSLWDAGVFRNVSRLDAFWVVIMSAREDRGHEEVLQFPDPEPFKIGSEKLTEMGVAKARACEIMAASHGSWEDAMRILGWE